MPLPLLNDLLDKEMDRKEFLVRTGAAVLAIVGVAGVLKSFHDADSQSASQGYGAGAYGGRSGSKISKS